MLNAVNIAGRLTRDPELRYTTSQKPVSSFVLAVERDFSPAGGERGVDFIPCFAWNGTAEFVSKWFKKGSRAIVSGRLQIREWKDNEGNKRTAAEVVADKVYFGVSKHADRGADDAHGGGGDLPF